MKQSLLFLNFVGILYQVINVTLWLAYDISYEYVSLFYHVHIFLNCHFFLYKKQKQYWIHMFIIHKVNGY